MGRMFAGRKTKKSKRATRGDRRAFASAFAGLGALGEPVSLTIGAGLLAAGATSLWAMLKGGAESAYQPIQELAKGCSQQQAEAALARAAASGAATGASTGNPYAAGASAGIAVLPDILQCGPALINKAKKALCKKADRVASQLKAKGAKIPKAWGSFSCDEKIAWIAALGPTGVAQVLAGQLIGKFATDAADEVKKWRGQALTNAGKFGSTAKNAAKNVGSAFESAGNAAANLFKF